MIWYCDKTMCGKGNEGWVIGKKGKVKPSDRYFSDFAKWNGYRIFLRYESGGEVIPCMCGDCYFYNKVVIQSGENRGSYENKLKLKFHKIIIP